MKKLLSLVSFFGITVSSALSIVACGKTRGTENPPSPPNTDLSAQQKAIDKAIEKLKNQTISITVTVGNENTVKNAVKDNDDFKSKLSDSEITIESIEFKKNYNKFHGTFQNNEEYEVIMKIKKVDSAKGKAAEDTVTFKIKIIHLTDQQNVDTAITALNKISAEEISVATVNLANEAEIKKAILNLQAYKDAMKDVILDNSFTLRNNSKAVVTAVSNDEIITVEGKIKSGSVNKNFKFTVKVKELVDVDQQKIDTAANELNKIDKQIELTTINLTVEKLTEEIKDLKEYKDNVKDGVSLKTGFILKKSDLDVTTIADGDVITVPGIIELNGKKANFEFKIEIKEKVDADQQKVDTAVVALNKITAEEISVATVNLANEAEIKKAILNLQSYKNALKDVILENSFTLRNNSEAILTAVKDGEIITVEGNVKSGSIQKKATFTVKVKVTFSDLEKVNAAVKEINKIKDEPIHLPSDKIKVVHLRTAIKNLEKINNIIKDKDVSNSSWTLKNTNGFLLKNTTNIKNDEIIIVEGNVKSESIERKVTFTVKIKAQK